jgi:hypothetical protein
MLIPCVVYSSIEDRNLRYKVYKACMLLSGCVGIYKHSLLSKESSFKQETE